MRILFDATPLQTGHRARGIGTYTRELLRALLALDSDNDYLLVVHGGETELCRDLALSSLPARVALLSLPKPPLGRIRCRRRPGCRRAGLGCGLGGDAHAPPAT